MVEELKLAIKVDDDSIEQSLLKQFANAQKMADKVVLDFKNVNFDDKGIEAKFKALQKKAGQNPIDLSISKDSIQMLSQISDKLGDIFKIAQGKSFVDSSSTVSNVKGIVDSVEKLNSVLDKSFNTKNKTDAFKQLKDSFKNFSIGVLVDGFDKAGAEAGYIFWKSYEEAVNKNISESRLSEFGDIKNNKLQLSDGIIDDYKNILLDYKEIESEIAKNNNGILPLFDENITKKINDYVYSLYRVREAEKDIANINNIPSNQRDSYKEEELSAANGVKEYYETIANNNRDFILSQIQLQSQLQNEFKETQEQAEKTAEAEKKLAEVKKETTSTNSSSDNSQIEDLKSDIQEVKTELVDVKDRITSIESNGLENVREDVEKTKESVKELNSELTEMKSNLSSSTQAETNISSENNQRKDAFPKTSENLEQVAQSEQKVQQEAVATDKALDNISFTPNTEGFEDIIAKFGILREQAEQITKIVKATKQTADGADISYKATLKNGSSYYLGENSTPQVLNASETVYDAKAVAKNAEQEAKAVQAEWDKNIKAIQDYMDAMTKLNNLKAKDKGTGSEANQITLQIQNVEELKQVAFEARQNLSSMQAENPDIIAWKQWVDMMELFDQASKGSAESAAKLKDVLDNIKVPSLDKYENKLSSYLNRISGYDATIARFEDGGWTSDEYLKNIQAVKNAVKEYEDLLKELKGKDASLVTSEEINKLDKYEKKIKDTIATVTNMSASEKGYNFVSGQKELDKIHKILEENSRMSSEAKAKIKAYYKQIESGNPSMSLDKIHGEIMKIVNAEKEAGRAGKSMWSAIKEKAWYGAASAIGTYFGVNDIFRYGKEAVQVIRELDDALVDLEKTTTMSGAELNNFYYDANDVAKQMGVTTKEIIDQASAWSRLGYSSKESATEMAKLSSQFASISPGMDINTATDGLVSTMKAFDIDVSNVQREVMDNINKIGNTAATSNDEIVDMLTRSSAAMSAANNTLEETIALETAAVEITRSAETTGTAFKTLSMRLRGYDEETESYTGDVEELSGAIADLTKTAKTPGGISLFTDDSKQTYKSTYQLLKEISDIYSDLSDKNRAELLEKLAGKRGGQVVAGLLSNFSAAEKAMQDMGEAAGSSDAEMSIIESSISYKINALKETWVGTVQELINRGDIGKLVDGLTKLSEALGFVIDKLGILGSVGLGAGIFSGIKNVGRDKMYSLSF